MVKLFNINHEERTQWDPSRENTHYNGKKLDLLKIQRRTQNPKIEQCIQIFQGKNRFHSQFLFAVPWV